MSLHSNYGIVLTRPNQRPDHRPQSITIWIWTYCGMRWYAVAEQFIFIHRKKFRNGNYLEKRKHFSLTEIQFHDNYLLYERWLEVSVQTWFITHCRDIFRGNCLGKRNYNGWSSVKLLAVGNHYLADIKQRDHIKERNGNAS